MFLRFLALAVFSLAALTLNICLGDVTLTPWQALDLILHPAAQTASGGLSEIIWQIRLPRLLTAAATGAALAVSGYLLQALSRNRLADPYLTGVSSGSAVAVALCVIAGLDFAFIPPAAFAGGLAAALLVASLAVSPLGLSVTRLLLAGVALSAICSGVITLLLSMAGNLLATQGLFFWLAGGVAGRGWSDLTQVAAYTFFGTVMAFLMSKQIRLLSLGTSSAQALGLDVNRVQWLLLTGAVLLCGAAVSVSGMVGFVGLIAPNVVRQIFGRDERAHVIAAAFVGMILVTLSDLAARTLIAGQEMPLGTLLALVGGPFFLFLVSRQRGEAL